MSPVSTRRCILTLLLLIAAVVFFAGINWGLPSRASDRFLFGDVPPWSGQKIMQLAGDRPDDAQLGANVPTHVLDRNGVVLLNETDEDRARIIRRYRLYSAQPDENTLLMAIGRMKPARLDFDPHFYQYGGWFVYPVAGMLKLAGVFRYLKLTPDVAYYLDHPEQFGRFYIVARSWAALWGLVGVWAVFWIGRRMTGNLWSATILTLAYIFMPVVINQAHEAKPHLQAAVLTLLAVIAGFKFIETGNRRYAWLTGGLCGAAFGSVLYMAFALAVLPVMAWRCGGFKMLIVTSLIAIGVYVIGNPYVAINLLRNREVLRSNLGNSTDMYVVSWRGISTAVRWLMAGASPVVPLAAVLGLLAFIFSPSPGTPGEGRGGGAFLLAKEETPTLTLPLSTGRGKNAEQRLLCLLLAAPFVLIAAQYVLLADGKPAEYGRFAIYLDIVLAVIAWGAVGLIRKKVDSHLLGVMILTTTILSGVGYLQAYYRDFTRQHASNRIASLGGGREIGLWAEPAPYSMPPVDLFHNELVLLPPASRSIAGGRPISLLIEPIDNPQWSPLPPPGFAHQTIQGDSLAPLSWADKPFEIYFRNPPPQ